MSKERESKEEEIAIVREGILASTIQIELFSKGKMESGVKRIFVDEGLGTLIAYNGQQFIMTHNHWRLSVAEVERVELRNANGDLLLTIDGALFVSMVHYRDAGTLLLKAPPQLAGMKAARLGDTNELAIDDTLWLATRDKEQHGVIRVIKAEVTQAGAVDMPGSLRLQGPATAVAPGDSGGGVWHEGKLVGNMWAIIESLQGTPWAWQGWFSSPSQLEKTGSYLMAQNPLPQPTDAGNVHQPAHVVLDNPHKGGYLP